METPNESEPDRNEKIKSRAVELCERAGLDPWFWTTVDWDIHSSIKEQNWEMYKEEAEDQLADGEYDE